MRVNELSLSAQWVGVAFDVCLADVDHSRMRLILVRLPDGA
jgi:hypothetical protein